MTPHLHFHRTPTHAGFTSAGVSRSSDKSPSDIVRELLQNSFDAAIVEGEAQQAVVKFHLEEIDKKNIPGLKDYKSAIECIRKEERTLNALQKGVFSAIREEINKDTIPVLFITDNGIGFDKKHLVAVLSDGESQKPDSSGGAVGNGHFSAFNASSLRYVMYGGIQHRQKLASGHAILRSHRYNGKLKSGDGYYILGEGDIVEENDNFPASENIPSIILSKLDEIQKENPSGSVVAILGFNYFDRNSDETADLILGTAARNFFVAIEGGLLEVETKIGGNLRKLSRANLEYVLENTEKYKGIKPKYEKAAKFYKALKEGKELTVMTEEGKAKIYCNKSQVNKFHTAVCRNGMWIKDNPFSAWSRGHFGNHEPHDVLVMPDKNSELSGLIRCAESNLHNDIKLGRISNKEDKKQLKNAIKAIQKRLLEDLPKKKDQRIDVHIPGLEIEMIGDSSSANKGRCRISKTVNVNLRNRFGVEEGGGPVIYPPKPSDPKRRKRNSIEKRKVGKIFEIAGLSSVHKGNNAKVKFKTVKEASSLQLWVEVDAGRDPSCDVAGNSGSPGLRVISAKCQNEALPKDAIDGSLITLGKKPADSEIEIDIEYETDANQDYALFYDIRDAKKKAPSNAK